MQDFLGSKEVVLISLYRKSKALKDRSSSSSLRANNKRQIDDRIEEASLILGVRVARTKRLIH